MKHVVRAAFLTTGLGLLMTFAFNLEQPSAFFNNDARTVYFAATMFMVFGALTLKNVLGYQTKTKINYTPKHNELKSSGLGLTVVLLFAIAPMFDQTIKFGICDCQWIRWVGCLFMIDAITFFSWSSWILGKKYYRNDGNPSDLAIIDAGPYAIIRHPRYLGLMTWGIATALVFNNVIALVFAVLLIWIARLKAHDEEVMRELEFGEKWLEYNKRTYRFLPMIY